MTDATLTQHEQSEFDDMIEANSVDAEQSARVVVTAEVIAYSVVFVLAVVLRLAYLNGVFITDMEAPQALAAWRALTGLGGGETIVPESPILFTLQSLSFAMLGGTAFAARLTTAVVGALLVVSPLLFRGVFGRARAFALTLLLLTSPSLLVASRFSAPVIWSLGFTVLTLWALWRFWQSRETGYGLTASAAFAALLLLTEPGGLVLGLVLVVAGAATVGLLPLEDDEVDLWDEARSRLRDFPAAFGLALGAVTVVIVSTGFMLYQPGLSAVGEVLAQGLGGFVRRELGTPFAFALTSSLFYEMTLWVFGIVGVVMATRSGWVSLVDRFFAVWLVVAVFTALLYGNAGPEHALWLVVPLAGLASGVLTALLTEDDRPTWVTDIFDGKTYRYNVPWWAKWLVAIVMALLLVMLTMHLQVLARVSIGTLNGTIGEVFTELQALRPSTLSAVIFLMTILLIIVGYFIPAGIFGNTISLQGIGLGVLLFGTFSALGAGWQVAVARVDDPRELWHMEVVSTDAALLRSTLLEIADRETAGFLELPLTVVADGALIRDDGVLAWVVRDFEDVRFVPDVSEARGDRVVIVPQRPEPPPLGGAYVGQSFVINEGWSASSMRGLDGLAWWLARQTRDDGSPVRVVVLWLRQDVYDGSRLNENSVNQ